MKSALTDEQKEEGEKKKRDPAIVGAGKVKQLYDDKKPVLGKCDKVESGYDNTESTRCKVQQSYKGLKSGAVHPTSSTATQQLTAQTAVNMEPQSATGPRASRVTVKMTVLAVITLVAVIISLCLGVAYGVSKCQSCHKQTTSAIPSYTSDEDKGKDVNRTTEAAIQQTSELGTTKASEFNGLHTTAPANTIPLRAPAVDIHPNATWVQNGTTVAGGNGKGSGTDQLNNPVGLCADDDQTNYVADQVNHRIVEWKSGATNGQVVAGGNRQGNGAHQLSHPRDVIIDKKRDSLIICDLGNRRVVRWPRRIGTSGETIIADIACWGLTMDGNESLYVVDNGKNEVSRYSMGDTVGAVVAGKNGKGNRFDQLSSPAYVFVDRDHSVYVSDYENHRVMKWKDGAIEGVVVAGGHEEGNSLSQLAYPRGVVVDQLGTVYVADQHNNRIMRWPKGDTQGTVIAAGNGQGGQSNQLYYPVGLSFDRHGNLYVVDHNNHRVQKFNID